MIAKPFRNSRHAVALAALVKRLLKTHPKYNYLHDEMMQIIAGDRGEEIVMKELEKLKLPYQFYVFHSRYLYSETSFQMDILVISPYYALIFEVKNISGEIEILTNPSILVRTKPTGEINSYKSPVPQLEEYTHQLSILFHENKINLPIYRAITFAFASSYVKTVPDNNTFLLTNEVRKYIRDLPIKKPILTESQLDHLKNWLLHKNKEFSPFPLSRYYDIKPMEIKTGVECLACAYIGMKKLKRSWICPKCRSQSRQAHEKTLHDYFLIYKDSINNEECRRFFHLSDKYNANRILKNPKLIATGQSRNTHYKMNPIT